MDTLTSTAHAAAGTSLPCSMWWNSCSSSPPILHWYPSCSRWRREGSPHGRLSLPAHWLASRPLADAAVRRSCWSAWQESLLCNAACRKEFVPRSLASHRALPLHCVWWAVCLSCGNSTLSFAGFNSWNFVDLHVSGRKTLRASGCNVEEQIFFSNKFLGVFAFGLFWGYFFYAIQDPASLFFKYFVTNTLTNF